MGFNSGFKGLMLYRETVTVRDSYKVTNTQRRRNVEFSNVRPPGVV